MSVLKTLTTSDGATKIYPITSAKGVYDKNGNVLQDVVDALPTKNTTYTFTQDGTTLTIADSDGASQDITLGGDTSDKMDKTNPTGTGSFSLNRKADTTVGTNSFAEGDTTAASGSASHAEGIKTTAFGSNSHAEGYSMTSVYGILPDLSSSTTDETIISYWEVDGDFSLAKGTNSHVEGSSCLALGNQSHAEGAYTCASGANSHAEGGGSRASGQSSHAEGYGTASGSLSHAECYGTASGNYSHAEGDNVKASGTASHAEGLHTLASGDYQHVQGKYSVEDTSDTYAHIVGGGTSDTERKNIHTVDWSGNAVYAGTITDGTGNVLSDKQDKETTLSGYGITDAKIEDGTITLGGNTIVPTTASDLMTAAELDALFS